MFVTFEGSEGSGKSTQITLLATYLEGLGYRIVTTREPGGTIIGEQVRDCLHDVENRTMTSEAEVLLYSASRAQLVREVILPALSDGQIVLSDRYADSTLAYQGYGRQMNLKALMSITEFTTGGLKPDLTVMFDIDVAKGLERRTVAGDEMNRMDLQAVAFYERVRRGYLEMAEADPNRWVIIEAGREVMKVQEDLRRFVLERLMSN
jgi:dTMP kinase